MKWNEICKIHVVHADENSEKHGVGAQNMEVGHLVSRR
jgi:hypothetical protein